jgi:hypothetical protein
MGGATMGWLPANTNIDEGAVDPVHATLTVYAITVCYYLFNF